MMRAREISLRKVVGAKRRQLVVQFLGESVLTAMIALVLALALTEILLPLFDRVLGLPIEFHYFRRLAASADHRGRGRGGRPAERRLSGAGAVGVPAGFHACADRHGAGQGSGLLRTALVVLQFAVSIGLGIAAAGDVRPDLLHPKRRSGLPARMRLWLSNTSSIPPSTVDSLARALRSQPGYRRCGHFRRRTFQRRSQQSSPPMRPGATSSEQFATDPGQPRLHASLWHTASGGPAAVGTARRRRVCLAQCMARTVSRSMS